VKSLFARRLGLSAMTIALMAAPLASFVSPDKASATGTDDSLYVEAFLGVIAGTPNNYSIVLDATADLSFGVPSGVVSIVDTSSATTLCTANTFVDGVSDSNGGEIYQASCVSNASEQAGDVIQAEYAGAGASDYADAVSNSLTVMPPDTTISNIPSVNGVGESFTPQFTSGANDPGVESTTPHVCTVDSSGTVHNIATGTCTLRATDEFNLETGVYTDPNSVAVDPFGDVYVADQGTGSPGSGNNDGGLYSYTGPFAGFSSSSRIGTFNPGYVATNASGELYILDNYNENLAELTLPELRQSLIPSYLGMPPLGVTAMAEDSSGNLYIAGANFGMQELTPQPQNQVLTDNIGYSGNPTAMAIDNANDIFIADGVSNSITELVPQNSNFVGHVVYSSSNLNPDGMALDASGTLYVSSASNASIAMIAPNQSGNADISYVGNQLVNAQSVAVDPQGNIYVVSAPSQSTPSLLTAIVPQKLQSYTVSNVGSAEIDMQFNIPASGDTVALPLGGDTNSEVVSCGATGTFDPTSTSCVYPPSSGATTADVTVSFSSTAGVTFGNYLGWNGVTDLQEVTNWTGNWTSFDCAFYGATQLTSVPTTLPSSVTDLGETFYGASAFNEYLGGWDTSNVTTMEAMFAFASDFSNGGLPLIQQNGGWDTSNVTSMAGMFAGDVAFNQDVSSWSTSNVTNMSGMFAIDPEFTNGFASWPEATGHWDTSHVTNMAGMFSGDANFNTNIGSWNTGAVQSMSSMFESASLFNQDLSFWDTSNVTDMASMFSGATAFNQNISSWNTVNVDDMSFMFEGATAFNNGGYPMASYVGGWSTNSVTTMSNMFQGDLAFNQDISSWDTQHVTTMRSMFVNASSFNNGGIDLRSTSGGWNTASVTDMSEMFTYANDFNQDISTWRFDRIYDMTFMFLDDGFSEQNYSALLNSLATQVQASGVHSVNLGASTMHAENSQTAYNYLTTNSSWTISDGGEDTSLAVGNSASMSLDFLIPSGGDVIHIPVTGDDTSLTVNCGGQGQWDGTSGNCTFPASATSYHVTTAVAISQTTGVSFGNCLGWQGMGGDLTAVNSWSGNWTSLSCAFTGATQLTSVPTNFPTAVTSTYEMFAGDTSFDQDVSSWNTINVTDMNDMFNGATSFNNGEAPFTSSIGGWNTSNVTNMYGMFDGASSFNQDISTWNTLNVQDMSLMFDGATAFNNNGTLLDTFAGGWNTSNVSWMYNMFNGATSFNQDISSWNTLNVQDMSGMFFGATLFNNGGDPLNTSPGGWNTSQVQYMTAMFAFDTPFNQDISSWNTSFVTNMSGMFYATNFDNAYASLVSTPGGWNTSLVSDMNSMFQNDIQFDQDISSWNTASVRSMQDMFAGATSFNNGESPLQTNPGGWDTSLVHTFSSMFEGDTTFNQDISTWNTMAATDMTNMFNGAIAFNNGGVGLVTTHNGWNTSNVVYLYGMFDGDTAFNQDMSSWNFGNVQDMVNFAVQSGLTSANYGILLSTLASELQSSSLQANVELDVSVAFPDAEVADRNALIGDGWVINDGGQFTSYTVPNIVGLSTAAALAAIANAGFTTTPTETPVTAGATAANNGQVVSQTVTAGTAESVATVSIDFSYYHYVAPVIVQSPVYIMPTLTGLSVSAALSALSAAGFTATPTETPQNVGATTTNNGNVATQSVSAGSVLKSPGINIAFSYYNYVPPTFTMPTLTGLSVSAALSALSTAGFTATPTETPQNAGATTTNNGIVATQSVAAGSIETDPTTPITLDVYTYTASPSNSVVSVTCVFAVGSSAISKSCAKALATLAQKVTSLSLKKVSLTSYGDLSGSAKSKRSVALARSEALKKYLIGLLKARNAHVPAINIQTAVVSGPRLESTHSVVVVTS